MTSDDRMATVPRDRSGKANARRAKIVQAARELFAEHGFHATGMARISERSGVLVGQIYRDFANKEAIVAALAEQDLADFLGGDELCAGRCAIDRVAVRAWIERFITCADMPDERLVSEIIAETARNPRLAEIFRSLDERLRERLMEALRTIVPDARAIESLRCLAESILVVSAGVFQRRLVKNRETPPAVVAMLMDFIDRELDRLGAPG
ncbi:TetR/AcrR family transcriptional regulator [Sphingomonas sp. BK235]|uniref:TetR/AcrR family transcriptional regulator n=1 Tax=Sphingomonas sp. BK235 TaxID=2512131 RepID=UPI0014056107|nr:TetR/AcrR family transcriptional regulator [Sphingomonas sp. BK235]